ncbi:MAG: beta-ketoacyl synthase N-terminal-like domain-containing protein [bacterium]
MTVAITGIGLVCPAGIGLAASLARLAVGPLAPRRPEGPEGDALPDPPILTVPEAFDPRPLLKRRKDRKLMARANELAVGAAHAAAAAAGLLDALDAAGLYLGVGREPGNLDDILPVLAHSHTDGRFDAGRLVAEGMGQMNPLSSLKTLPNMSLAHVAINLGIHGPGQALTDDAGAGTRALLEAATAVAEGLVDVALAGGADARTAFTDRSTALRLGQTGPLGEAAAVFVLERADRARARGARILGFVGAADDQTPAPASHLGDCGAATDVAALALALGAGQAAAAGGVQVSPARAPALHLRRSSEPVAITGIGGVTPLGHDFERFTARLLAGESAVAPIRGFDAPGFPVRLACEVVDAPPLPDQLAAAFAGLDDRKGELAAGAALAAVADHGGLPAGAGLIYATGLSSVSVAEIDQDSLPFLKENGEFDYAAFAAAPPAPRPQAPARHLVSRPADLIAAYFGLRPRAQHFSACAAGAAAIAHAAELIRRGEAEVMLAGGADSMVHPFGLLPFILLGATTTEADPRRAGRPFEADRDGFVMGEGAPSSSWSPSPAPAPPGGRCMAWCSAPAAPATPGT